MDNIKVWGIHTQDDRLFLDENVIAIGWKAMGDLSTIKQDKDSFKEKYKTVYPSASKNSVGNCVGSLFRFAVEMKVGDKVAIMKQYFDGNYNTIIYSTKMIDKINELVDAVNKLMDKEDKE